MMEHKIDLICRECSYRIKDAKKTDYFYDQGQKRFPCCPDCGAVMKHDVTGICRPGDYRHVSDSLAFHPADIPEHRQKFPGVEVTPEGQPVFTSPKQQEKYAEKSGFHKKRQRIRRKGRKIA